jgi:ABC-type antimicrobial peptide transport system permease subunit
MTQNRFIITMLVIFTIVMLLTVVLGFFLYNQHMTFWVNGENLFEWSYWKYISGLVGFIAMLFYWLIRRKQIGS